MPSPPLMPPRSLVRKPSFRISRNISAYYEASSSRSLKVSEESWNDFHHSDSYRHSSEHVFERGTTNIPPFVRKRNERRGGLFRNNSDDSIMRSKKGITRSGSDDSLSTRRRGVFRNNSDESLGTSSHNSSFRRKSKGNIKFDSFVR